MFSDSEPERFTIDEVCFISSESGIIMAHMKDASFFDAFLLVSTPGLVPDEFDLAGSGLTGSVRCRVIDRQRGGMHVAFVQPEAHTA